MPTACISNQKTAEAVQTKIAELESQGAINFSVSAIGDQYLIAYDMKPRPGRPPKMETR